jgi:hypothetical protein
MERLSGQGCPKMGGELFQIASPLLKFAGASAFGRNTNGREVRSPDPRSPVAHNVLARPIVGYTVIRSLSAELSEDLRGKFLLSLSLTIDARAIECNPKRPLKLQL